MFRCDFCESYCDRSECMENPITHCGTICEECADSYEEGKRKEKREKEELTKLLKSKEKEDG